jgi:hypothetical protein
MTTSPRVPDICSLVLSTCRRIYDEAAPILYSCNLFDFNCTQSFGPFLDRIGPTHTHQIKSAALRIWNNYALWFDWNWDRDRNWGWECAARSFKRMANLQTFEITIDTGDGSSDLRDAAKRVLSLARTMTEDHPSLRTGGKTVVRCSQPDQ